nr:hypothetical protein [Tanacetum cinerariifolium]
MIQPEPERSTQGYSTRYVVVLRYEKRSKSENKGKVPTEMELVLEQTQQGTSYEISVSAERVKELKRKVKIKGEKKESLLTLRQKLERFNTTTGNPVKEILLILNLPDHRSILTNSKEYIKMDVKVPGSSSLTRFIATCSYSIDNYEDIMKAQNIKKDDYTHFQHQERYAHVGPEVTSSQEGKRSQDDDKRLCLVDDLNEFKITFISSQRHMSNPKVNDHYINSQLKIEVKDYELKTKVKAWGVRF